ncbi:hypothetical protein ACRE_016240 [Hapsidospora chrysogenum ATCC 11550]|uniref:Uncharacterized protein n=1 Tax=Hapsidospora chrysogenum (strain ATCC 11550 / CBS 779.69 / DSM 880 / IAM 14645 / JCM 23072 / IMI 49137) TaxID=857340 RepID=A0A086TDU5_HAPC1|nr:hypothetical protein ACRE_016240 [Hapsidospora chrysogenum ATCC 11550]
MASPTGSRPPSPTPSQLPPVPASPVYSVASTANPLSAFSLPLPPPPRPAHAVLTTADLERSREAYSELVSSAKAYRVALASLSTAASAFGSALESCARLKEARAEPVGPIASAANMSASFTTKGSCTADTLMSASGVQHLIANHQQILSETVYRSFEVPLLDDLDQWQTVMDDEKETYQQRMGAQTKEIRRLEKEGLKLHKQRKRDVSRFRAHLVELTGKLDGLTALHADHARTLLRESQETSGRVADASCSLVRAEVDIFESLARKGWSGGGLDDILEKGQDLFAADDVAGASEAPPKLFSILPPKSILADSASDKSRAAVGAGHRHTRSDSLLVDANQYQPLTAVAESHAAAGDADSVMSTEFSKPRNARPFSPQPIRRISTDVTFDSLGAAVATGSSRHGDGDEMLGRSELWMPAVNGEIREEDERENERESEQDREEQHEEEDERNDARADDRSETPERPARRESPDFITDESSPDSNK